MPPVPPPRLAGAAPPSAVDASKLPPGVAQRSSKKAPKLGNLYEEDTTQSHLVLTAEETYLLDVSGYIVVRGALSAVEVAAAASSPGDWSATGSSLKPILDELLGEDNRLDIAPGMLPQLDSTESDASQLVGGGWSAEGRRLRYWDHHAPRRVLGIRVVIALADVAAGAGGLTLLPASHKSTVAPPPVVVENPNGTAAAYLLDQPALVAGDALIMAGSLARGLFPWRGKGPQLLLGATFASARAYPAAGYAVPSGSTPYWFDEVTPEQRSVATARFTGVGGSQHGGGGHIDQRMVSDLPPGGEDTSGMNTEERWFWDLAGILVIRGVMDTEWLTEANAVLDKYERDPERAWTATDVLATRADGKAGKLDISDDSDATWAAGSSPQLLGKPRPRLGGLYELPHPDCLPFRRMMAHKVVDARLQSILGYGYHETQEPIANIWPPGTGGFSLHSDPGKLGYSDAVSGDGRIQCDQVNVQWSCGDVTSAGGGFAYVPGSHKALYPMPVDERASMDLACVRVPQLNAGDVLLFGGVTHGAAAWREDPTGNRVASHRRAIIHFYQSKTMSLGAGNIVAGATPKVAPPARL